MKPKILIVEDEPSMGSGLKDNLEFEGYDADIALNGMEGLQRLLTNTYDLVLLDVMMPEMSGLDVCRKARSQGVNTPIIFLTAKSEEVDKIVGLELGADDYITKPFSLRELLARVKAALRRAGSAKDDNRSKEEFRIGKLTVNFNSLVASDADGPVKMSHKEYAIIKYLLDHKNEIISRQELLEKVWGYEESPTTRTVDNFIVKIRHKVEEDANNPRIIITVHGTGYKLIA